MPKHTVSERKKNKKKKRGSLKDVFKSFRESNLGSGKVKFGDKAKPVARRKKKKTKKK